MKDTHCLITMSQRDARTEMDEAKFNLYDHAIGFIVLKKSTLIRKRKLSAKDFVAKGLPFRYPDIEIFRSTSPR